MNAASIIVSIDRLDEPKPVTSPDHRGRLVGWVHFDEFAFHGRDPAKFRRIAEALNTCADQLDTAAASHAATPEVHD